MISIIIIRSDVEEGGETVFPNTYFGENSFDWSRCAYKALAIKPVRLNLILENFENVILKGERRCIDVL